MDVPLCSAKACRATAKHAVVWNNPRVHTPEREKIWHACDEHVQHLSEFVGRRGFLIRVDLLSAHSLSEVSEKAPEDPTLPS